MTTPAVANTTVAQLEEIIAAAATAAPILATRAPAEIAEWLDAAADALDAEAEALLPLAEEETHLPARPRLAGELLRTTFQLRFFGNLLREGAHLGATIDHADSDWPMGPRPDIRRHHVPFGPVLVFAASNFPFAFSVAGGDTASALAAGCPVILKAHPGHPRLSDLTGKIVAEALTKAGAPYGTFAVIHGVDVGVTALRDPRIAASSFTGSVPGGRALFDIAAARPVPIPFYGELGSVNPVVVTPGAVRERGAELVKAYVGSFTLGAGQFCTKPGLLFLPEGHGLTDELAAAVGATKAQPLLNEHIASGFASRLSTLESEAGVRVLVGDDTNDKSAPHPTLVMVSGEDFAANIEALREECFGPSSLVITYGDLGELLDLLGGLEPSLTATIQGQTDEAGQEEEADLVNLLLPILGRLAGRILWNEWPTGVTVSWAQQHGGPYPATTAPGTTSVGAAAITRFLRPVAWQGFPHTFLPPALREENPWKVPQRVDGQLRLP
jgi:NADP-dependent aldehyde dehydrogenase